MTRRTSMKIGIQEYLENLFSSVDEIVDKKGVPIEFFAKVGGLNVGTLKNKRFLWKQGQLPRKSTLLKIERAINFFTQN